MHFWEDAIKGSSALLAGLRRRLQDECAVALGQDTASIYWDIEKFFDSVDWVKAIEWAEELGFPSRIFKIAMQIHTAPRIIKIGKVFAQPFTPSNGLVAGCLSAVLLSRIVVCSLLTEVHAGVAPLARKFYDDITSRVAGKGPLAPTLARHGLKLARVLKKANLKGYGR